MWVQTWCWFNAFWLQILQENNHFQGETIKKTRILIVLKIVKVKENEEDYTEALDRLEADSKDEIVSERKFFKSFDNNLNKRIEMVKKNRKHFNV